MEAPPRLEMERPSKGSASAFSEIWRRQLGLSHPRIFFRHVGGSQALVKRLNLHGKLRGHTGCVNSIQFNRSGDLLVSGSDDRDIIFWNWAAKIKKLSYSSGHLDNVLQAQIMPFTNDRTIITSAADGQVRVGQIAENGHVSTKLLGIHHGWAHKLAIEPGSPHVFYSCGEDGLVQHFDLRTRAPTKLFYCSSFSDRQQPIHLNAIVIDPRNPFYVAVGGHDEYARVYDIRNCQWDSWNDSDQPVNTFSPHHLIGKDNVHITGLAYSYASELLASYNDELVYLFQKDMGLGANRSALLAKNLSNLSQPQAYSGHRNSKTIKGVSFFGPSDEYVVSGSDCGHIFIWKKKGGELLCMRAADKHVVNCVEPHPHFPFLATSGIDRSVKLWTPTANKQVPLPKNVKEVMAANKRGREARARVTLSPDVIMHVLRLQRRQALAYAEHGPSAGDPDSDEDNEEVDFILGLLDSDATSEEGSSVDPGDCIVS